MNEVEKKQIEEMAKVMYGIEAFELEVLAEALYNAGYGKVEDYKKEIFALKTTLEDREHEVRELNKKVERLEEENKKLKLSFPIKIKVPQKSYKQILEDTERFIFDNIETEIIDVEAIKQQAIKEFDKELRNRIKIFYDDDDGFIMKQCEFDMLLKSIAEEYGIGEK